jgi:Flp pilus assembly protein TadD
MSYLAVLYREQKDYPGAVKVLEDMVERYPDNDRYRFTLGATYDEAGEKQKAIAEMRRAIEINPQNASALNYLGYTYADLGIQLDEAERLIRRALDIAPNDGFYIDSLGWVYYQRGQYEQAVEHLERAAELAGEDPTIVEHLGDAYQRMGKTDNARRVYSDALGLATETDQIDRLKNKIQALGGGGRATSAPY